MEISCRIVSYFKLFILITSSVPEYNFTTLKKNFGHTNSGGLPWQSELHQLCPYEKSVLIHGECVYCISLTRNERKKSRIVDGFDCPTHGEIIFRRRIAAGAKKLNGLTLNVVTIQRKPFSKSEGNIYSGVVFEFLYALQAKYNFSINTFLPYDGNWGSKDKNGSWNGMIGQIVRQEADIGASAFSVTIERAAVVDFTVAYHQEPTAILIPAPEEGEKLTVIIRPLSHEVWLALLFTTIVLIPTFYILHICSLAITKDSTIKNKSCLSIVGRNLMFMTGSLVQESVTSPVNKTTRFLLAIWWMATLILANIYMAFLVSYLSVPKLYNIVDSLEDLAHQSQLKWTFRKGTAHHSLFKSHSSVGIFKTIGDQVEENQLVSTDIEGVQRVLEEHMAFIKEKSFLDVALGDDFESHKKCRLTLAKKYFFTVGIAFVVQKKAEYLSLLDFEISNALATGLLDKWKTIHWPNDLWCSDAASFIISTQPPTRKLTINDLQGAYFILGCGLTCAVIASCLEQLYFRGKAIRFIASSVSTAPLIISMR